MAPGTDVIAGRQCEDRVPPRQVIPRTLRGGTLHDTKRRVQLALRRGEPGRGESAVATFVNAKQCDSSAPQRWHVGPASLSARQTGQESGMDGLVTEERRE